MRKLVPRLGAEVIERIVMATIAGATAPEAQRRFVVRAAQIDSPVLEADIRYPTDPGSRGTRRGCCRARTGR